VLTLYPAVDIKDGRAVRLTQGKADEETVYDVDPVAAAERFAAAGPRGCTWSTSTPRSPASPATGT
jgi:phosphoribosylformimino-5-aminoimidazole carboxamide ribonucleotide (ProFAR) isomerase